MKNQDKPAIVVTNVTKTFKISADKSRSVKSKLLSRVSKGHREFTPLDGVSFTVDKGDFFGIVGRNGSGKSTLLKMIAGIYAPTKGKITVNGTLVPFIELGVGFNPQLSGKDNVYLNCALLGFSREETDKMYDEIVDFAELHDFMEERLQNYSSGMQVRLAFSISIRARGDILILDEVLAVGDAAFQRKCNEYFEKIKEDKTKTIVLVTHSMENVRKYCNKAMMIREGEIVAFGSPEDVANEYSLENLSAKQSAGKQLDKRPQSVKGFKVELLSGSQVDQDQEVEVRVSYKAQKATEAYIVVGLQDIDRNVRLFTKFGEATKLSSKQTVSQTFYFDTSKLNDASIKVMVAVYDQDDQPLVYNEDHDSPRFQIRRSDYSVRKKTSALLINDEEPQQET